MDIKEKDDKKCCFIAFGELALDVTYGDDNYIIREVGGVSAFNTLYNLSVFGEETYAIGGVGTDINAFKALNSLKETFANTDNIRFLNKATNVFYIYKPSKVTKDDGEINIGRKSPITGKSTIEWSDKLCTELPEEFKDRNIILAVSNFERVTKEFIKNAKSKAKSCHVSLDITNGKIFDKYPEEYIWEHLKQVDLLQCNEQTFEAVSRKLNISSPQELFSRLNVQIFTLTKGSNGATFFYRDENGEEKSLNQRPKIIAPIVDTTGVGDAFHSMLLMCYHRKLFNNEMIDEDYLKNAFDVANALARKVVQIEGARGERTELLKHMLGEIAQQNLENGERG